MAQRIIQSSLKFIFEVAKNYAFVSYAIQFEDMK